MITATATPALSYMSHSRNHNETLRFEGHPTHQHDCPQLIYLVVGSATVVARDRSLTIAEEEGVWLPTGVPHSLHLEEGGIAMGPVLDATGEPPGSKVRLMGGPRLRRLMTTLLSVAPRTDSQRMAFRSAIEHTLHELSDQYFPLPLPENPAALAIAESAASSHSNLADLARKHYVSSRHVQRLFVEQTGLTFSTWRTRARLNIAIARLRAGRDIAAALEASGFTTREGLLKALSRECQIPLDDVTRDPVRALSTSEK